jgi:excisionase family DNA binding protein
MSESEILDELINKLAVRLRPIIYEVVNDCLASLKAPEEPNDDPNELWTIKDVMKYFGCAKTTVFKWRKQGLIKSHRFGSKVYFKKAELLRAVKQQ